MIHFSLMTQDSFPCRSKAVNEWADLYTSWEDMVEKYVKYACTLQLLSAVATGRQTRFGVMGMPCVGSRDQS
jgi:hypothetical protein